MESASVLLFALSFPTVMKLSHTLVFAVVLSCAAVPGLASAQEYATDRGSLSLGGSAGITRSSHTNVSEETRWESHSTFAYLSPAVQYFVSPGLALGGALNILHNRNEDSSFTSYAAGPILSYYFGRGDQTLHPFISGQASLTRSGGETSGLYGASACAGMSFRIYEASPRLATPPGVHERERRHNGV